MAPAADEDDGAQGFLSHLVELRTRLLYAVAGWLLLSLALIPFGNRLYGMLATPFRAALPEGAQMIAIDPAENTAKSGVQLDKPRLNTPIDGLSIGVPRHIFEDDPDLNPDVRAAFAATLVAALRIGAGVSTSWRVSKRLRWLSTVRPRSDDST